MAEDMNNPSDDPAVEGSETAEDSFSELTSHEKEVSPLADDDTGDPTSGTETEHHGPSIHGEGFTAGRGIIAVAGDKNIVAENVDLSTNLREESRLVEVGSEALEFIEQFYVAPRDLGGAKRPSERRLRKAGILILKGEEGSGRLMSALFLASKLVDIEKGRILHCRWKSSQDDLQALIEKSSGAPDQQGVLILEDAFDGGVDENELRSPLVKSLQQSLRKAFCVLILTTTTASCPSGITGLGLSTAGVDLRKVLEKALAKTADLMEDEHRREAIDQLTAEKTFTKPAEIHYFVERLEKLLEKQGGLPSNKAQRQKLFRRVAKEAVDPGQFVLGPWFEQLSLEERLWAFLTVFFESLSYQELSALYRLVVTRLRSRGLSEVPNSGSLPLNTVLRNLHLRLESGFVQWKDSSYRDYVLKEQTEVHALLLWEVTEALLENPSARQILEPVAMRRGMGNLLGEMSRRSFGRWQYRLQDLAKSDDWRHGNIVSYAVRCLVGFEGDEIESDDDLVDEITTVSEDPEDQREIDRQWNKTRDQALRLMARWARSKDPNLKWTAAASAWQAYESLLRARGEDIAIRVSHLLREAAKGSWADNKRGKDSAAFAIARILSVRGARPLFLEQLRWWCSVDSRQDYPQIALKGMARFVKESRQKAPFGQVVSFCEVLSRAQWSSEKKWRVYFRPEFRAVFEHMADRWMSTEYGYQAVSAAARILSTRLSGDQRSRWLRHTTENWTKGREGLLARKVWGRATAMEGSWIYPPSSGDETVLLVIDSEILFCETSSVDRGAKTNELKLLEVEDVTVDWIRRLTAELKGRWRPIFGLLGRTVIYDSLEELLNAELPLKGHGAALHPHPLAVPCFSSLDGPPVLGVTVSRRDVWDLRDFRNQVSRSVHIRLEPKDSGQDLLEEESVLRFSNPSDNTDFEGWRACVHRIGTEFLAMAGPLTWWPFLRRIGLNTRSTEEEIWQGLHRLKDDWHAGEEDLDRCESEDSPETLDSVRLTSGVIGYLAAVDLSACCRRLARGLDDLPEYRETWPDPGPEAGAAENGESFERWKILAGARFLFRLHRHTPFGTVSGLPDLFEVLAPSLAKADPAEGLETVIRAVESWLEQPEWVSFLASDVIDGRGRLIRWAEAYLPDSAADLAQKLPETFTPEAQTLWSQALYLRRGKRLRIPELGEGRRYGMVVMASGAESDERMQATALIEHLQGLPDIEPLLFQVGRTAPIWVRGEKTVEPWDGYSHPALLQPILEQPGLSPDEVAFVLILGPGDHLDAMELATGIWWRHLIRYPGLRRGEEPKPLEGGLRRLGHRPRSSATPVEMLKRAVQETMEHTLAVPPGGQTERSEHHHGV